MMMHNSILSDEDIVALKKTNGFIHVVSSDSFSFIIKRITDYYVYDEKRTIDLGHEENFFHLDAFGKFIVETYMITSTEDLVIENMKNSGQILYGDDMINFIFNKNKNQQIISCNSIPIQSGIIEFFKCIGCTNKIRGI